MNDTFSEVTTDGIGIFAIVAEETELNEKLESLRAGNWQALQDMPRCELDELADKVAHVQHIGEFTDGISVMRHEASEAILAEQVRRDTEQAEQSRMRQRRVTNISRAVGLLAEANTLVNIAASIPDESPAQPKLPSVDVASATDDELISVRGECEKIVDASQAKMLSEHAKAIGLLKTPASKQISAELRKKSQRDSDRYNAARELIHCINTELEHRERARAEAEEREKPASLIARIEALEAQLREGGKNA